MGASSTTVKSSASKFPPEPKLLTDQPWRSYSNYGDVLESSVLKDIKKLRPEKKPNILLLGPVGAGKSSFINSCLTIGETRQKTLAQTGSAAGSLTLEFKSYKDSALLKNFRLMDCMGIEQRDDCGFHPEDLSFLLQGHVKKKYEFVPENPMTEESKYYRKKPKFEHKTHCVVFVVTASAMYNGIPDPYVRKIKDLQDKIKRADVPRVLILTKADELCGEVYKCASLIFSSVILENAMRKASEVFSIEMVSIHPVINYVEDVELSTAKNLPILLALRQIMQYACDRVDQVLNESESEDDSD